MYLSPAVHIATTVRHHAFSGKQKLAVAIAAIVLLALTLSAFFFNYLPFDLDLTRYVQTNAPLWIEPIMRTSSWLGGTPQLLGVLALVTAVLFVRSHRDHVLLPAGVAAIALIAVPLTKEAISRPRPTENLVEVLTVVGGQSFPSGHAFMSISILGVVFYLANRLCGDDRVATLALRGGSVAAIALIGISRIYLGVHWTSDVLGGYIMGGLALIVVIKLLERRRATASANQATVRIR